MPFKHCGAVTLRAVFVSGRGGWGGLWSREGREVSTSARVLLERTVVGGGHKSLLRYRLSEGQPDPL